MEELRHRNDRRFSRILRIVNNWKSTQWVCGRTQNLLWKTLLLGRISQAAVCLHVTSDHDILCSRRWNSGELWLIPLTNSTGWRPQSQHQQHQGLLRNIGAWCFPRINLSKLPFQKDFKTFMNISLGIKSVFCFLEHHHLHLQVQHLGLVFPSAILGLSEPTIPKRAPFVYTWQIHVFLSIHIHLQNY